MVTKDEWFRSAMSDDRMVADLLLRLRHPHSPSPSFSSSSSASFARPSSSSLPPPRWGIRLPRSRMAYRCDAAPSCSPEKKPDSARNSPTTPLAWSTGGGGGVGDGGVSSSGATNGSDESTLPVFRSFGVRSKVVGADDPGTTDAKKSKRKKTFAELKDEEVELLKERVFLKEEIATLRMTFKERAATNENLKRMKLGFDLNAANGSTMAADEKKGTASSLEKDTALTHRTPPSSQDACWRVGSSSCQISLPGEEPDGGFLLPDLNMTPSEDDFPLEVLHGATEAIRVTAS
ncbi:hypothetical protein MLD38_013975 [Melastoma candidum]|uniref:Uncharacterized protein n=1 Tax=Melastoma candidum TaxID=119954 RepID=A0ACB9RB88_9MYRT|nr:hypothetical protein MLD38_013975 [Melastoma candidum]